MAFSPGPRQARRGFLVAGLGLTLVLAGCQTGPRAPRLPGPGAIVPVAVDPIDTQRNLVAVIVPTSGADGAVGQSIANAANLALIDSGDRTIRITVYNSAGMGGAAAAAQRAIAQGNRLILGPLLAEEVRAAAPIARRAEVPIVAFSNDESVAGQGVFIMGFTPDQSIDRVIAFARSKGMARFAALVPTGLYGQRASQAMLAAMRKSGGRLTVIEQYNRSPAAVRTTATGLKSKGVFDAVLIGDSGRIAASAAPHCPRRRSFSVPNYGPVTRRSVGPRRCAVPGMRRRPTFASTSSARATARVMAKRPIALPASAMTRCCWRCEVRGSGRSAALFRSAG